MMATATTNSRWLRLVAAAAACLTVKVAQAHPLCYIGDTNPVLDVESTFCPNEEPDGFCCSPAEEAGLQATLEGSGATGECAALYEEVLCGICHPWSAHLFERLDVPDGLTMTNDFCNEFFSACESQLGLASDYCDIHTGGDVDQYWSYPLTIDASFDDDGLIKAFPSLPDGDLPIQPIDMRMTPDGTKWWVAGMEGEIKELDAIDPDSASTVVDLSDKIIVSTEEGLLAFAFSPDFHNNGVFYVSYSTEGTEGEFTANRISRLIYDPSSSTATSESEDILITTSDKKSTIHSAGWVGFKPSAYADPSAAFHELYWSMGDSGPQYDIYNRAQDVTEFHGSIVRISVPSDPLATGYEIPSDNPYASGGGLGEICANGFRNPFRCSFDKETDELYCGDVGHLSIESVNLIECGNNYGWRQFEGDRCSDQIESDFEPCETADRSAFTFPIYQYCHPSYFPADEESYLIDQDICGDRTITGGAVIVNRVGDGMLGHHKGTASTWMTCNLFSQPCGFVYRGTKFDDLLGGHYIFAEHVMQSLNHLIPSEGGWDYGTIDNSSIPEIAGFGEGNDGEQYIIGYKGGIYELPCGCLCDGSCPASEPANTPVPTPAVAISDAPIVAATPAPTTTAIGTVAPTPAVVATTSPAVVTESPVVALTEQPIVGTASPGAATPAPSMVLEETTDAPAAAATPAPSAMKVTDAPAEMPVATMAPVSKPAPETEAPVLMPVATMAPVSEPEPETGAPIAATLAPAPEPTSRPTSMPSAPDGPEGTPKPAPVYTPPPIRMPDPKYTFAPVATPTTEPSAAPVMTTTPQPVGTPEPEDTDMPVAAPTPPRTPTPPPATETPPTSPPTPEEDDDMAFDPEFCDRSFGEDVVPLQDTPTEVEAEYLGCWADAKTTHDMRILQLAYLSDEMMSPSMCEAFCRDAGADIFGLQYGKQCLCGDTRDVDYEQYGPAECEMPCSGEPGTTCGGYLGADIYFIGGGPPVPVGSTYLGCMRDEKITSEARAIFEGLLVCPGAMTTAMCEQFCRSKNAVVYGLQYGHECFCGQEYDHDQYGPGVCNQRCDGDPHATCGGYLAQNVYSLV